MSSELHINIKPGCHLIINYPTQVLCSVVAIVFQYLLMASFMWMLMEVVTVYVQITKMLLGGKVKYIMGFTVISYGESVYTIQQFLTH